MRVGVGIPSSVPRLCEHTKFFCVCRRDSLRVGGRGGSCRARIFPTECELPSSVGVSISTDVSVSGGALACVVPLFWLVFDSELDSSECTVFSSTESEVVCCVVLCAVTRGCCLPASQHRAKPEMTALMTRVVGLAGSSNLCHHQSPLARTARPYRRQS